MAGIYDRLSRMHEAIQERLTITRSTSGTGRWSPAPGLPGIGDRVDLPDSFFGLAPRAQVREIIALLAALVAPAAFAPAYAWACDGVGQYRGLGPS